MDGMGQYSGKAECYQQYRLPYEPAAVCYMTESAGICAGTQMADIGAGTGTVSLLLNGSAGRIYAVEPNDDMRKECERQCEEYHCIQVVKGRAEATNLPDQSVDVIVAGQAFHWFEPVGAKREFQRILRSGGKLALIGNRADEAAVIVQEQQKVFRKFCPSYKTGMNEEMMESAYQKFFHNGRYVHRRFSAAMTVSLDGFVGGSLSASYALKKGDEKFSDFVGALEKVYHFCRRDGEVTMPYYTDVYVGIL